MLSLSSLLLFPSSPEQVYGCSQSVNVFMELMDQLQSAPLPKLKKLTQAECDYCLEALSIFENFSHECPVLDRIDSNRIREISTKLSERNCISFLLHSIIALVKNLFNCMTCRRIDSDQTDLDQISSNRLQEKIRFSWKNYLEKNAEVHGDLETADYIYLGNTHILRYQNNFRTRIIDHYAHDDDLVLVEGCSFSTRIKRKSGHSIKKKLEYRGWDEPEKVKKSIPIVQRISVIAKRIEEIKETTEKQSKQVEAELDKLDEEAAQLFKEFCQLSSERSKTMVDTITKVKREFGQKVFVISGTGHLLASKFKDYENDYNVMHQLKDLKCAMVIPIRTQELDPRERHAFYERGCTMPDE